MIILRAQRILTLAEFSLHHQTFGDEPGQTGKPETFGIGYASIDATGSVNTCDMVDVLDRLFQRAADYMGESLGMGWHDVL